MKKNYVNVGLALLGLALAACQPIPASQAAQECLVDFEATVHRGPNEGLMLVGDLELQIEPSGSLTGVLTQADRQEVTATGQANGQAINLVFDLGDGAFIFGVGSLQNDISDCQGAIGGPFTGPQPGDSGDWGYALGGRAGR